MHILILGALPKSLVNFRGDLIRTLVRSGHRITAMGAPADLPTTQQIEELGATFRPFPVQRNGLNPWKDIQTFMALCRAFCQTKPDVILAYTIKPVIWGGLASWLCRNARFYALITGLGFAFQGRGLKRTLLKRMVSWLYRLALRNPQNVIFQNAEHKRTIYLEPAFNTVLL